jgi:hypothetical protein
MSKQTPDKVFYRDQEYLLAGLKGSGLLTPKDFGIKPESMAFFCARGYFCQYSCHERTLSLNGFTVATHTDLLPVIDGVSASSNPPALAHFYQNLHVPCPLSGGLVIVRELVALTGIVPNPTAFAKVLELIYDQGTLQNEIDHSSKMPELRQRFTTAAKDILAETLEIADLQKFAFENRSAELQERIQNFTAIWQPVDDIIWSFAPGYTQQPRL